MCGWVAGSNGRKSNFAELDIKSFDLKKIVTNETCRQISGQKVEQKLCTIGLNDSYEQEFLIMYVVVPDCSLQACMWLSQTVGMFAVVPDCKHVCGCPRLWLCPAPYLPPAQDSCGASEVAQTYNRYSVGTTLQ